MIIHKFSKKKRLKIKILKINTCVLNDSAVIFFSETVSQTNETSVSNDKCPGEHPYEIDWDARQKFGNKP